MAVWEGCFAGEKMTFLKGFAFGTVLAFAEVLLGAYRIPRMITYLFNSKIKQQLFCHFTASILVPLRGTPTGRLHIKLCKFC